MKLNLALGCAGGGFSYATPFYRQRSFERETQRRLDCGGVAGVADLAAIRVRLVVAVDLFRDSRGGLKTGDAGQQEQGQDKAYKPPGGGALRWHDPLADSLAQCCGLGSWACREAL